jgi:filamentous hemagglutinin family protein
MTSKMLAISVLSWGTLASLLITAPEAMAQLKPDATVGTIAAPAGVVNGQQSDRILGGTSKGGNLFHSFTDFNVAALRGVYFIAPPGATNILTRVTGASRSQIDGTLGVLGNANLFLLNPNGISFGGGAKLAMAGSLFLSTARAIAFEDGTSFSTTPSPALLTISTPIGLQYGQAPAAITIEGSGHRFTQSSINPSQRQGGFPSLTTAPGRTLALIGGSVNLNGGDVFAPGGRVELGAVGDNAFVRLAALPTPLGASWVVGYEGVAQFGAVNLTRRSAVDVSGAGAIGAGSIQVQGRTVSITDGSLLFSGNGGNLNAGKIQINAIDSFELAGIGNDGFSSQIETLAFGQGRGGDIAIETQRFIERDGARLRTVNYGPGSGGNVAIRARESAVISGVSAFDRTFGSTITTATFSTLGGNITIDTPRFEVVNAALISSASFATGTGGDITINASRIALTSPDPTVGNSIISTSGFGVKRAGTLRLNTDRLEMLDGSTIASSVFNRSIGGSVIINASESILLANEKNTASGIQRSNINAAATEADFVLQKALGVPKIPQGDAGNVIIQTPSLVLQNRSRISAKNDGSGNAGTVLINVDRLSLDRESRIAADTASGEGGNIELNAREQIILRRGSLLTATAGGNGNGGNISLNTPFLVAVPGENSDIVAQALQGKGGNIQIAATGIYGIEARSPLTPLSDINASSAFGLSGSVTITNLNVDPSTGLAELPTGLEDATQRIALGCEGNDGNRFVATGRGGVPENPLQVVGGARVWQDLRGGGGAGRSLAVAVGSRLVEASAIRVNGNNQVELLAAIEPKLGWASCAGGR